MRFSSAMKAFVALTAMLCLASGCGGAKSPAVTDAKSPAEKTTAETTKSKPAEPGGHSHAGHSHDEWWCAEHGVPEEVCGQCSPKVAAEMKKKGDWCQKHDRPDSQCFVCHPEKAEGFAAQYEAKYGKPPKKL